MEDKWKGRKWTTLKDWEDDFRAFQRNNKRLYFTRFSGLLPQTKTDNAHELLHVQYRVYHCKMGSSQPSNSKELQKNSTCERACPAMIKIEVDEHRNYLEVTEWNDNHSGHDDSQIFHDHFLEVRKLEVPLQREVLQLNELNVSTKEIQNFLRTKHNKQVSTEDIESLVGEFQSPDDDNLETLCDLLKNTFHVEVNVLEEKKVLKGLYCCTEEMKQLLSDWPEVVFIDCNYKFSKRNFPLMLTAVEDNNGNTRVVGIGILVDKDKSTMEWFFKCFVKSHQAACKNILAFMTHAEFRGRNMLKHIFEGKSTFICTFDTLRVFSKDVTLKKMGITTPEKALCKELFSKLVKSQTEQEYETSYAEFVKIAPKSVQEYFNVTWKPYKLEWTHYSMFHNNLGNITNNRLKSLRTHIKFFMKPTDDLVPAVKNLFKALESRDNEMEFARAQRILKREIVFRYAMDSVEMKYKNELTSYAFQYVIKELEGHKAITVNHEDIDGDKCVVHTGDQVFTVTPTTCSCNIAMGFLMPCRHIFAVREQLHLPLFDEKLCGRWSKRGLERGEALVLSKSVPCKETSQSIPSEELSVSQKRELLKPILDNIVEMMMQCSEAVFERRLALLKEMADLWSRGIEFSIQVIESLEQVKENLTGGSSFQSSLQASQKSQTNDEDGEGAVGYDSVRIVEDENFNIAGVNVKPRRRLDPRHKVSTYMAKKRKRN